ncbi:MAG: hypothetical protein DA330_01945 [Nitrososphaera sp.]|nr:hypothetical protein [Nitrososphaera sp.]
MTDRLSGSLLATIFAALVSSVSVSLQVSYADECPRDTDWPEKPCPAYGTESEAELRDRWDGYHDMKGQEWMEAKRMEMEKAIIVGNFREWINNTPDDSLANRNVYFYYRLNDLAPLMVLDVSSGEYFRSEQDPDLFSYSAITGDYYVGPAPEPWYMQSPGIYAIIGIGSVAVLASFFAFWKVKNKKTAA